MSQNIGTSPHSHRGYIGLALESEFGGGPEPSTFVDAVSDDFEIDNQISYDDDTTRSRGKHKGEMGPLSDEGGTDAPANPENGLGIGLLAVLGGEDFTAEDPDGDGTDDVGVHTFYPSDTLPSVAVEVGRDTDVNRHVGAGFDTLELTHASEERLTWSGSIIAQKPTVVDNPSAPTYSDLRNFWYHDGSLSFAGTDRSADVREVTSTFENSFETHYRDDRVLGKIGVGARLVQWEAELDFETDELFRAMLGSPDATEPEPTQEPVAMDLAWNSPETINGTTEQYALEATAPTCKIETHNANLDGNALIAENVTITALVDPQLGYECEWTLKNGITEPYA